MKRLPQSQIDSEARHLIMGLTARCGERGLTRVLQSVRRQLKAKKLSEKSVKGGILHVDGRKGVT